MKSFADGTGVCFDLRPFDADAFIENYKHLKETQDSRRVDFNVAKSKSLPALSEEGGSSYSRGGGGNGGGYGGNGGGGFGGRGSKFGGGDRGDRNDRRDRSGGNRGYGSKRNDDGYSRGGGGGDHAD